MRTHELSHVNDAVLLRDLDALASQERGVLAKVLAHLGEVDARRLYLPAGYPSMYEYCLRHLGWSEQAALKRLRAARAAREFPVIFDALAEGRLHLTAVVLLAPCLTAENAGELLAAAAHRTKAEIEELVAQRFPRPDAPTKLEPLVPAPLSLTSLSPGTVSTAGDTGPMAATQAPGLAPRLAPCAPERFVLQFTIGKETYEKLRCVQELLSHRIPSGDVVQVFDRALDALKERLEKQKFAATAKPRPRSPRRRSSPNPRYIPASVKRAVWARDGGQCTFVNAAGERCPARRMLEFDHVDPVARGGRATVNGLRILCRGHNQYEAERRFGAGFMNEKRAKCRGAASQAPARTATEARTGIPIATAPARVAPGQAPIAAAGQARLATGQAPIAAASARLEAVPREQVRDVMAGLRALGFRAGEARRAAEFCETLLDATLDDRVRAALRFLCPAYG